MFSISSSHWKRPLSGPKTRLSVRENTLDEERYIAGNPNFTFHLETTMGSDELCIRPEVSLVF